MLSDLVPPSEPDPFFCLSVLDELSQPCQSSRSPHDAAVQSDRHHLWRPVDPFLIQLIEGGYEVLRKVIRGDERLVGRVLVVVAVE